MAVTEETEALWSVEATMLHIGWQFGGRHGNKPQMREFPPGVEAAQQASEYTEKRAAAWRRKYADRLPS